MIFLIHLYVFNYSYIYSATTKLLEALCKFVDLTSNTPKILNKAINTTTEASIIIANAMSLADISTTNTTDSTNPNPNPNPNPSPKKHVIISFEEKLASVNEHVALVQQLINEFKEQQVCEYKGIYVCVWVCMYRCTRCVHMYC